MNPRRLGVGVSVLVLFSSGAYMLVYLYRWEWNRAVISGIFFVAAEVALFAIAVMRRLHAIEERLERDDRLGTAPPPGWEPPPLGRIRETAPEHSSPFAWLEPGDGRMGVFVPVLMGAGVVISALAWFVERVATVTARPGLEWRLAQRLVALEPPVHGLVPAVAPGRAAAPIVAVDTHRRSHAVQRVLALPAVALLLAAGVQVLEDATQSRPHAITPGTVTNVEIEVSRKRTGRSIVGVAEAFWVACRYTLPATHTATDISMRGPAGALIVVTPALGHLGERRLRGCLEDATFDRVTARVVSMRSPSDD